MRVFVSSTFRVEMLAQTPAGTPQSLTRRATMVITSRSEYITVFFSRFENYLDANTLQSSDRSNVWRLFIGVLRRIPLPAPQIGADRRIRTASQVVPAIPLSEPYFGVWCEFVYVRVELT
jgi:hypothetical protein